MQDANVDTDATRMLQCTLNSIMLRAYELLMFGTSPRRRRVQSAATLALFIKITIRF